MKTHCAENKPDFFFRLDNSLKICGIFLSRHAFAALVLILAAGLGLRVLIHCLEPVLDRDAVITYMPMLQAWARGGYDAIWKTDPEWGWIPPLYTCLSYLGVKAGLSAEQAGLFINLTAGTLTIIPIYAILNLLTDNKILALCGALLAAVHPDLIDISGSCIRDPLYLMFGAYALWAGVHYLKKGGCVSMASCGIFTAFAAQTRFESLEIPALLAFAFIFFVVWKTRPFKTLVRDAAVFAVVFAGVFILLAILMGSREQVVQKYPERVKLYLNRFTGR